VRQTLVIIACIVSLLSFGNLALAQPLSSNERSDILSLFDTSIYQRREGYPQPFITKWEEQIRVQVLSKSGIPPGFMESVTANFLKVQMQSKVPLLWSELMPNFLIVVINNTEDDIDFFFNNINKFFKSPVETRQFLAPIKSGEANCVRWLAISTDLRPVGFVAILSIKSTAAADSCLLRSLLQGFGMSGNDTNVDSIFNRKKSIRFLTKLDYVALRFLYDKSIRSGQTSDEVVPVVKSVISDPSYTGNLR
jgi:hypothetical protein